MGVCGGEFWFRGGEFDGTGWGSLEDLGEIAGGLALVAFVGCGLGGGDGAGLLTLADVRPSEKTEIGGNGKRSYPLLIEDIISEAHDLSTRIRWFDSPLARWLFRLDVCRGEVAALEERYKQAHFQSHGR